MKMLLKTKRRTQISQNNGQSWDFIQPTKLSCPLCFVKRETKREACQKIAGEQAKQRSAHATERCTKLPTNISLEATGFAWLIQLHILTAAQRLAPLSLFGEPIVLEREILYVCALQFRLSTAYAPAYFKFKNRAATLARFSSKLKLTEANSNRKLLSKRLLVMKQTASLSAAIKLVARRRASDAQQCTSTRSSKKQALVLWQAVA